MFMLLDNNTERVMDLIDMYDNLNEVDKIRLGLYILENKNFNVNFNIEDMIILLKIVLNILDLSYSKTIVNFAKYKNLLFISAKYMELSTLEKQKFSVEMLFNIFQYDFKNDNINTIINNNLNVYDYYYSLNLL
jgi:glycyl-tRNA synthetase alpha subunit